MVHPAEIVNAAYRGDTAAIQEWFSTGVRDLDERDHYGVTLLHFAAWNDRCDTMRFLLDHGASVDITINHRDIPLPASPLHGAAMYGNLDAAVLLLDRGAQTELADSRGLTPLLEAASAGHCDMIRLLLSRGAALAPRDKYGRNAETLARCHNNKDEAADLLADVRRAGDWLSYLRYPRKRLLALRVLCERGRASTDDDLLLRLFPWYPPVTVQDDEADEPPPTHARTPQAAQLPKEVFWLVFKFWRSDRDSRY